MLPRIELAGLTVSAYYLCMVLGFAAMIGLMLRRRARFSLDVPGAVLFACLIMLSGLVGCKALYLLENLQYTMENGISLGGFSFFGAVFLVPVVMSLFKGLFHLTLRQSLDASALCGCVMLGTLRVGCFLSGCCGGWVAQIGKYSICWPTQAMESIGDFAILLWLLDREDRGLALYPRVLAAYGVLRFFIEFLRDTPKDWLYLSHGQWFAIASFAIGFICIGNEKRMAAAEK